MEGAQCRVRTEVSAWRACWAAQTFTTLCVHTTEGLGVLDLEAADD